SVSSVSGVDGKKPAPADARLDHDPFFRSAETRGLTKVPYSLWTSTRPLADTDSQLETATSSCANTPGTVYWYANRGTSSGWNASRSNAAPTTQVWRPVAWRAVISANDVSCVSRSR